MTKVGIASIGSAEFNRERPYAIPSEGPGALFGVVEFRGAAGLFAEDGIDVTKGLLKHGRGPGGMV